MKDIAVRTGLGLATISKYLNGGTVRPHNKILIDEAVSALHFVPNEFARSLKTRQSRTIGVIIPELNNTFITSIISTMEDMLRQHDYAVIVCDCRTEIKREKEAVSFLLHKRVDGLINMPTDPTGAHLVPMLEADIPIVLVDRMLKPLIGKVSAVVVDNADASEKAVCHLLEYGHKNIGIVLGDSGLYTSNKRLRGYLDALESADIPPNHEYIFYSDYTVQGGYDAVKRLLQLPTPPSALFITNYELTLGAMIALNELGVNVPEELSVIGFDKLDLFRPIYPNLTVIKQPQHAIGECIANQMLQLLAGGPNNFIHQIITLATQLQDESSVKRI